MSDTLELVTGGCQLSIMGAESQIQWPEKQQGVLNVDPSLQVTNFYLTTNEQLPHLLYMCVKIALLSQVRKQKSLNKTTI